MSKRKHIEVLSANTLSHVYQRPFEIKFYEGKDKRSFGVAVYDIESFKVFGRGYYNFNLDTILDEVKQDLESNKNLNIVEFSNVLELVVDFLKSSDRK
jgi:hypothetical protein